MLITNAPRPCTIRGEALTITDHINRGRIRQWLSVSLPTKIDPDNVPGLGMPEDQSLTIILDPAEPFMFLSVDTGKDEDDESDDATADDQDDENDDDVQLPELKGIGFSWEGGIPFAPEVTWGLPAGTGAFKGNVYLEAKLPMGPWMEFDGKVVTYLGTDGLQQGGNGTVAFKFDLPGSDEEMEFELGPASVGYAVTSGEMSAYFSGTLDPQEALSFLPDQIEIEPSGEIKVAGSINSQRPSETRLRAEGQFELSADALAGPLGVRFDSITVDGELRIDADGFYLHGHTTASPHPSVGIGGELEVEAFVATAFGDSYIQLKCALEVSGVQMGATAEVLWNRDGFFISGTYDTPMSSTELSGEITASGPSLEGSTEIVFSLDGITAGLDEAQHNVSAARAAVASLEDQIAEMRQAVLTERDDQMAAVQAGVDAARDAVNTIQSDIDYNYSRINARNAEKAGWRRWYDRQSWWDKSWAW